MQESNPRARSNNPRFPWQAPRLTLRYWLFGTREEFKVTASHPSTINPPRAGDQHELFDPHDGRQAADTEVRGAIATSLEGLATHLARTLRDGLRWLRPPQLREQSSFVSTTGRQASDTENYPECASRPFPEECPELAEGASRRVR